MNSAPLFSVLLANFNNGKYLKETLASVYNQTYTNWEIIIVDDCSSDISLAIYKEIEHDKRIKIIRNDTNMGCGYTKRRCVEEAKGEICGFLDPDDTIESKALELMIEVHLKHPNVALIYSRLNLCDENLVFQSESKVPVKIESGQINFFNLEGVISAFSSFKKKNYNKTEGIAPNLKRAVDQDLYLKLYETGDVFFLDQVLYNYRIHDGGISTIHNRRKAYYWHWLVIMNTIQRRGINFENDFFNHFVPKHEYDSVVQKYSKYEWIDKIINKIKTKLGRK